jgi:hypothetical protein
MQQVKLILSLSLFIFISFLYPTHIFITVPPFSHFDYPSLLFVCPVAVPFSISCKHQEVVWTFPHIICACWIFSKHHKNSQIFIIKILMLYMWHFMYNSFLVSCVTSNGLSCKIWSSSIRVRDVPSVGILVWQIPFHTLRQTADFL